MLAHAMAHVVARHWTRLATKSDLMQIGMQASAAKMPNSNGMGVPLGMLAFQRANEREADFIAVKAMADAGYDPAGMASCVERLQPPAGATATVFQPLPDREERVSAIQAEIRKQPQRTYISSEDFARVKAQLKR
jgi:predicted Zn-dependent protease